MIKIQRLFKIILILTVLLIATILAGVKLITHKLDQPLTLKQPQLLTIAPGSNVNQFTRELMKRGMISSRLWLKSYVKLFPEQGEIKAGTYQVLPKMNAKQLLSLLTTGQEHQFSITFIEGSTFKEWLVLLKNHPAVIHTLKSNNYNTVTQQLKLAEGHPEGLFFPDTYLFTANTTDVDILLRARQQMSALLAKEWQSREQNLPYNTPYQALIMASIIEKESGRFAEHQLISSVFVNRLHKKMRLQTDPTVIYGLGERYKGDIKRKHLKEKTPYNTYRINGLPPTPIAMPGKSAIYATMHPEASNYYYFVSNGQGKHIFSSDLKAHNQAVAKYQLR